MGGEGEGGRQAREGEAAGAIRSRDGHDEAAGAALH